MCDTSAEIRAAIIAVLTNIPPEILEQVLVKLISQGVESKLDLQFIRDEDLLKHLQPVQCCKLIAVWKSERKQHFLKH